MGKVKWKDKFKEKRSNGNIQLLKESVHIFLLLLPLFMFLRVDDGEY